MTDLPAKPSEDLAEDVVAWYVPAFVVKAFGCGDIGGQPVGVDAWHGGLGGGIIRDTLLQHGPPLALLYPSYLLTAIGGALVAYFVNLKGWLWEHSYRLVDAVALGCWVAAGAERTLEVGLGWLPAVLLGTVTAVAGGVLRDLLLREVPQISAATPCMQPARPLRASPW